MNSRPNFIFSSSPVLCNKMANEKELYRQVMRSDWMRGKRRGIWVATGLRMVKLGIARFTRRLRCWLSFFTLRPLKICRWFTIDHPPPLNHPPTTGDRWTSRGGSLYPVNSTGSQFSLSFANRLFLKRFDCLSHYAEEGECHGHKRGALNGVSSEKSYNEITVECRDLLH